MHIRPVYNDQVLDICVDGSRSTTLIIGMKGPSPRIRVLSGFSDIRVAAAAIIEAVLQPTLHPAIILSFGS